MKSILDPSFQYTPSGQTDVSKTFARVRRELAMREKAGADSVCVRGPARQQGDHGWVHVLSIDGGVIQEFAPGIELATFVHESPSSWLPVNCELTQ